MNNDVAYQAGFEVAMLMKPRRNPFITGSSNAENWRKGYDAGCENLKSKQDTVKQSSLPAENSTSGQAQGDATYLIG